MKNIYRLVIIIVCIFLALTSFLIFKTQRNELINEYVGIIFSIFIFILTIQSKKSIRLPLLIAFLLRVSMCIIYNFVGDSDPDGYAEVAQSFMNINMIELFKNIPMGAYFYSWIISIFWRFTGNSITIIRVLNAILSYCCCVITYYITKEIYKDEKVQRKVVWCVAIFPSLIRFSSPFASRETFFVFILLMCILCTCRYYYRKQTKYLICSLAFFVIGIILHTAMLTFGVLYLFIVISKYKNQDIFNRVLKTSFFIIMIVGFIIILLKNDIGTEKFNIGGDGVSIQKVGWLQESSASGRAAYLTNLNFSNPVLIILMLPIRAVYFLYTPFIWMVRNILDVFGIIDAIMYIYLTYCIWKQYSEIKTKYKFVQYLLFATFTTVIFMAAATSNYGTALRHRAKIVTLLIIIAGPRIFKRKEN